MATITDKTGKMHNPAHPGEILRELYLKPLGITITQLAESLGVSRKHVSTIVNGHAPIQADARSIDHVPFIPRHSMDMAQGVGGRWPGPQSDMGVVHHGAVTDAPLLVLRLGGDAHLSTEERTPQLQVIRNGVPLGDERVRIRQLLAQQALNAMSRVRRIHPCAPVAYVTIIDHRLRRVQPSAPGIAAPGRAYRSPASQSVTSVSDWSRRSPRGLPRTKRVPSALTVQVTSLSIGIRRRRPLGRMKPPLTSTSITASRRSDVMMASPSLASPDPP